MKAYVVDESWDNCGDDDEVRTIGVFSSMEKAKAAVDKRITEKVTNVKDECPSVEVTFCTANNSHPGLYVYRGVYFKWPVDSVNKFGHVRFFYDNFDYFIKDFELDELKEADIYG